MTYDANYMENEILSMNGDELVEFMYRGIINFIEKAKSSLENKDVEGKVEFTKKAISVILYLESILDFEKGKDLAQKLSGLYEYAIRRLNEANMGGDSKVYDEVSSIFKELHSAWREGVILKKGKDSEKARQEGTPPEHTQNFEKSLEIYG